MTKQLELQLEQLDAVHQFMITLSRATEPGDIYETALTTLTATLEVEHAAILVYSVKKTLHVGASRGISDAGQAALGHISPWASDETNPKPLLVPDGILEQRADDLHELLRQEGIQCYVFIPLVLEAQLLGILLLGRTEPKAFENAEIQFAEDIANHVAFTISRMQSGPTLLHLKVFSDNAHESHFIIDRDGQFVYVNRAAQESLGYSEQELLQMRVHNIDPDFPQTAYRHVYKRTQRESLPPFESLHRKKDGSTFPVEVAVSSVIIDGVPYLSASARDISERKQAEVHQREHVQLIETLHRLGSSLVAELNLQRVVQAVTDAATELTGADFGAFFYNIIDQNGEAYQLYTLAGAPLESFSKFPHPRNTAVFGPTFRGERVIRLDDVTKDPSYGQNSPLHGMPEGHLPVRSYLAVPVISRAGEVIGGLFFGHKTPGMFTDYHERITVGIANWAAVAVDNARLYERMQQANEALEERVAERTEELRMVNERLEREKLFVQLLQKITAAANEARSIEDALQFAIDELCAHTGWPIGHALLTSRENPNELVSSGIWHEEDTERFRPLRQVSEAVSFRAGIGIPGRVLATAKPIWVDDLNDVKTSPRSSEMSAVGVHAGFAFPVMVGREITAVLEFFAEDAEALDEGLLEICANIGTQLGRVIERDRANAAFRQLTRQIVVAQEKERRRLSRELHDAAGQMLTALMINLTLLERKVADQDTSLAASVAEARGVADVAYEEIRAVSHALRPPSLDKSGLNESLQGLCVDFARQTDVKVAYSGEELSSIPDDIAITYYRFLQEALANVTKHARARNVQVVLHADESELRLEVMDDGIGFAVSEGLRPDSSSYGVGLLGLKERFDLLGGYLRIESEPGKGTRVIGGCRFD